jgi:peptidoglycan DL-endopeptidase CwlO
VPFALSRLSRRRVAALPAVCALTASALVFAMVPAATAYAAGTTSSGTTAAVAQAQQQVSALSVKADRAVEAYNEAQIAVAALNAQVSAARDAEVKQQSIVDAAQLGVQSFAVARYEGSAATPALAVFLASNPQSFLQQSELLEQVSSYESAALTTVVDADRALSAAQASATQAAASQQKALAVLAASKSTVDAVLGQQQAQLDKLQTQASQERVVEATAAVAAAKERQRLLASRSLPRTALKPRSDDPVSDGAQSVAAVTPVAASGHAAAALAFAYSQLDKPYRFGGAGPGSFDCSGLTMRAYAAAGISLAHSAADQQREGTPVSLGALQPGDLVFWGRPAYHVGIYVGGGNVLDAPHTGTVVQIQPIWGSPSGAVRP